MERLPVAQSIPALAERIGRPRFIGVCTDLMAGADRNDYVEELRGLTGHAWKPGDSIFDPQRWADYWVRTWGARGLLHVWDDAATPAIVSGLNDLHWRPVEMCLKVTARHEVAGAGDRVATLLGHGLPRVRMQALRALAIVGDTHHFSLVRAVAEDEQSVVRLEGERTLERMRKRLDVPCDYGG